MKTFLILLFSAIILSSIISHFLKNKKNAKLDIHNARTQKTMTQNNESNSNETVSSMEHNASIVDIDINSLAPELQDLYNIALNPIQKEYAVLYALVTCHHCIRTQRFLKSNGVDFKVVHADLFDGDARNNIMTQLRTLNERGSFPTLVMPTGDVIVGYKEAKIREAIDKHESE